MFIQHNEVFGGPNRSGGIHPLSFDRNLMASLLASIYSAVLKEPLPDKLASLVRQLETLEAVVKDR
jgi:hypothetical protein